jgi:hemolysin activation/secretion protein
LFHENFMPFSPRNLSLVAIVVSAATLPTYAQTVPDAGALQQQIERERQQQMPKRMAPDKPAAPAAMTPATGTVVTVKQFRFAGNTLLTSEQLAAAVAAYLNRPLDFAQLQAAAAAVAEAYRAAGWVVNAYLPQQDIKDGTVTFQIIEAVFGQLKTEGATPKRVPGSQVTAIFAAQQAPGTNLNATRLDRALLLADDLPGVAVAGSLVAGAREGETDLILKTADEPLVIGEVAADNTGTRSTGANRITASLNLASPFGMGDLLSVNAIHARGNDYLRLAYTLPVGSNGWRIGLNASDLRYQLVTLDPDKDKGSSGVTGLEASYPLIRSRLTNLYLNLNADHKTFDNEFGGATTTRYSIDSTSIALYGNRFDNWGGGGANSASLTWVNGERGNQIGTTNDHFSKLGFSLSRQQVINNNVSFFARVSGQESGDVLDSSERFYLGGAGGVRAYPSSEGAGDSGVLSSLELRWKLPADFVLTGFHDYGRVRNNDAALSYSLQGYGLSLGWQAPVGVNLKATWAHRMGDNPNPTPAGNDQDGSLTQGRLWLSASLTF